MRHTIEFIRIPHYMWTIQRKPDPVCRFWWHGWFKPCNSQSGADACRGRAAVGVSMWMRVLLPQVLGPDSDAFLGDGAKYANVSRLGTSAAAAALDMLDIAMAPGGARLGRAVCRNTAEKPEHRLR